MSPFMLFVCERNLMIVYSKRSESLCTGAMRWTGWTSGLGARGLIGGPPEWAAGEPLAAHTTAAATPHERGETGNGARLHGRRAESRRFACTTTRRKRARELASSKGRQNGGDGIIVRDIVGVVYARAIKGRSVRFIRS